MSETTPNLPVCKPVISERGMEAAAAVLRSGWLGYGPRCMELEQMACRQRGGWAVATQSCTAALWAVAMVARSDMRPEVIVPANTYIACASAFQIAGWKVRVCDVDPATGLLDLGDIPRHMTPATRALMVVDTYGQRFAEREARDFCDANGLWLVRDAAHRLDLDEAAQPLADFVCYSFGPTKEVASPDGGLVWSRVTALEEQVRALTYWGISHDTWQRSASRVHAPISVGSPGLKLRMTDVNAAIVLAQLEDWHAQREQRRALMACYGDALRGKQARLLQRAGDDSCLMAPVLVDPAARGGIRARLAAMGIATSDHYPSLAGLIDGPHAPLPNAEAFCPAVIAMPIHLGVTEDDIRRAATAFGQES